MRIIALVFVPFSVLRRQQHEGHDTASTRHTNIWLILRELGDTRVQPHPSPRDVWWRTTQRHTHRKTHRLTNRDGLTMSRGCTWLATRDDRGQFKLETCWFMSTDADATRVTRSHAQVTRTVEILIGSRSDSFPAVYCSGVAPRRMVHERSTMWNCCRNHEFAFTCL